MKRQLQALAVLLLFGVVKLPVEKAVAEHLLAAKLLSPPVDLGLRENLGQMSFAATLGGLRSLIASITYLQAYHEWENINWGKVDELFQLTTRLQPRYLNYWDEASWHMAFNAASSYRNNEKLDLKLREQLHDKYVQRGLTILNEGLRVLPGEAKLWNRLAELYQRRLDDPAKAGEAYLKAYELSGVEIYARMGGYQFAATKDPVLWRKAYEVLSAAYRKGQRPPSVITTLKSLEERLNIPLLQRIPDPAPVIPRPR